MTITLSSDQAQAIGEMGDKPVDVLDPSTQTHYVLIRADHYERVRALIGDAIDLDPRETYTAVDEVFREAWADPAMDAYDDYDAHKS